VALWAYPALGVESVVLVYTCDASKPATAPSARFNVNSDGTATDRKTGLTWMRCAVGQRWAEGRCTGQPVRYSWGEAFDAVTLFNRAGGFAGHADWRIPALPELASIVEHRCFDPAINLEVFQSFPITGYWTATPDPDYVSGAMLVHFKYGGEYMGNKSQDWAVLLVRGGAAGNMEP